MSQDFTFQPASFIPFRNTEVLGRVRALSGDDLIGHENPDFRINIIDDDMPGIISVADMFHEIVSARDEGRNCVLITPNPNPGYRHLAWLINKFRVNCSHVTTFNMDEWADEDGNIADESYAGSFIRATKKFWFNEIAEDLRMPESQVVYPTTKNITHYSDMLQEAGNADACYSGPGWSGHLAFIEPDVPEWSPDLEEFLTQGARLTSLHPLTVAQNSLHGSFGASGDLTAVPPMAATIGPLDVARSRRRIETHAITTAGTNVSWQRAISRLVLHGPVTPQVPSSILQRLGAEVYVTRTMAAPIHANELFQY